MAGFDQNAAQPPLKNEKSAFEMEEDDDGDLGSDIENDSPMVHGLASLRHQSSVTKNFGNMNQRNMAMLEEEKKESIDLSSAPDSHALFKQPSLPPQQEAGDKSGLEAMLEGQA